MSGNLLKIIFTVLGLLAISVSIWFIAPLLGFDDLLIVLPTILFVWVLVGGIWLATGLNRKKKAKDIEENIAASAADDDTGVLKSKLMDALTTMKKSSKRGGSAYLYDLPWYIIIGPPGSGKTTALRESGLKFGAGGAQAIGGVGGTRHCDWWFTEEAVLIDTAGRYTTQDVNVGADAASWTGFLDMLAENRPRQPINGAMVCISVEDLLTMQPSELDAHANAIRSRLDELHNRLKISFPVYVMITKMDLVAGFMEFFGDLNRDQRNAVWGTTFQPKDKTDNMVAAFDGEFDELMTALSDQLTDRVQQDTDPRNRSKIFGFPMQMASLKDTLNEFLIKVFEPSRYHADAALRGVYFTSGTQEGTPIDRVIGALSRNFGTKGAVAAPFSGQGKSFFLTDLMQQVIFLESGWVSTNVRYLRRMFAAKAAMYAALVAVVAGVGGVIGYAYLQNDRLQQEMDLAVDEYRELAANVINQTEVNDGDLAAVLPMLHKLRFIRAGYSTQGEPVPFTESVGLSQHARLRDANTAAYRDALERLFLPRLIWRIERLLEDNIQNTAFIYEGLKVYLMLGGQAKMDEELVRAWMARDWANNLYPGNTNAKGRQALMDHLSTLLERPSSAVALNGPLVQEAQRTLARMPVADRAYTLMKTRAESIGYEDWIASERGGPDAALVFETRDGAPLDQVAIPGFFTYEGFHDGVLGQMDFMVARIRDERWVLGEIGSQAGFEGQFATIREDILNRYREQFISSWDVQISRLKIASVGGTGDLTVLSALAAPGSPMKQLMVSLSQETMLTAPRAGEEGAPAEAAGDGGAATDTGVGLALNTLGQQAPAAVPATNPGERIEAHFKQLHDFAVAAAGQSAPVDQLVTRFNNLYQAANLVQFGSPSDKAQATATMQAELTAMKGEANRMPALIADITEGVTTELAGMALGTAKAQLNQSLADEVSRTCEQIVANRYPFFGGAQRDVPLADFARLFGPAGVMTRFFNEKLSGLVDQGGRNWRWREDTDLGRSLSNNALRQFQYAAEIRDAFFATGGGLPQVVFTVKPETLSANAYTVTFDVDGQKLVYDHGAARPMQMTWPGQGGGIVEIAVTPEMPGQRNKVTKQGAWGLYRMITEGSALRNADTMMVSFGIGGREASFTLQAASVLNPFALPALSQFRCPRGF